MLIMLNHFCVICTDRQLGLASNSRSSYFVMFMTSPQSELVVLPDGVQFPLPMDFCLDWRGSVVVHCLYLSQNLKRIVPVFHTANTLVLSSLDLKPFSEISISVGLIGLLLSASSIHCALSCPLQCLLCVCMFADCCSFLCHTASLPNGPCHLEKRYINPAIIIIPTYKW